MKAKEIYNRICKEKPLNPRRKKIDKNLHNDLGKILNQETLKRGQYGTEAYQETFMPMSIFLQPII